jgi:hypothetical protein
MVLASVQLEIDDFCSLVSIAMADNNANPVPPRKMASDDTPSTAAPAAGQKHGRDNDNADGDSERGGSAKRGRGNRGGRGRGNDKPWKKKSQGFGSHKYDRTVQFFLINYHAMTTAFILF